MTLWGRKKIIIKGTVVKAKGRNCQDHPVGEKGGEQVPAREWELPRGGLQKRRRKGVHPKQPFQREPEALLG